MTAKYIFWDCDSTLLENAELHWQKHQVVTSRYGLDIPSEYNELFYHNNGQQNWAVLNKEMGFDVPMEQYLSEIDQWYHTRVLEIPLRPGVQFALDYFKNNNGRQCIVTNARTSSVRPMIKNRGLELYFDFILCKEDYPNRKPHPDPYLTAHKRMEDLEGYMIDKNDCVAIEDDPYGVTSAAAAGIPVIHRRLKDDLPPAPDATKSVFNEADFLETLGL